MGLQFLIFANVEDFLHNDDKEMEILKCVAIQK